MRLLAASLLLPWSAAAAQPDVPEPPQLEEVPAHFSCAISRESPLGTIGVQQGVSPTGVADEPIFSWSRHLGDSGIWITTAWSAAPRGYSFVQLSYANANPERAYRFRVEGIQPEGQSELQLDSGLTRPLDGTVHVFTRWGTLVAMISEAYDPRIVLLDGDGTVVRSEPIDAGIFGQARELATRLQPELTPVIADYRRCTFLPARRIGDPISIPVE